MSFAKYPAYKHSGVEWLGEVPEHWGVVPLKRIICMQSGESITATDINTEGAYPVFGGNGLRGYTGNYTHTGDYVLIGRQGALCGNINYASGNFWASEHALVVTLRQVCSVFWLGELLRSMNLGQYSTSAAQPGLSVETLNKLPIPLPPLSEQTAIAAFLDAQTQKMDALVAEQEKLIALLKEKRQAVISHAVTKGLNPNAPMKESGVEWLGMVPKHWGVVQIKHLVNLVGGAGFPEEEQGVLTAEVPFFKVADLSHGLSVVSNTITKETAKKLRAKIFSSGCIAFAKVGAALLLQRYVIMPLSGCVDNNMLVAEIKSQEKVLVHWFHRLMGIIKLEWIVNPGAVPSINQEQVGSLRIPRPPLSEQTAIAAYLDTQTQKIDTLIAEAEKMIGLLKERRSALISAAVTGKIDVRGFAHTSENLAAS